MYANLRIKLYLIINTITSNIIRIRKEKGFSQENMAVMLAKTQPTYSRIESGKLPLTIDELEKIAKHLKTDISAFLDTQKITIQTQTNNEGAYGNGYVENLNVENKETNKKLIQALEDNIRQLKDENQHLKNEVEFLRNLISNKEI